MQPIRHEAKKPRTRITVDLPDDVIRELRIEAITRGKKLGDIVLEALLTRTRVVYRPENQR